MIEADDQGTLFPPDLPARFEALFGHPPNLVASAPGRVNLIGEHTDYNDGFVLPVAINRRTWIAARTTDQDEIEAVTDLDGVRIRVPLSDLEDHRQKGWFSYVAGVASLLRSSGIQIRGAQMLVSSTIPLSAGLSSSASLEVAAGVALLALAGRSLPTLDLVRLCQRAEWDWAGVQCGIMDQYVVTVGKSSSALFIDCRTLLSEQVPLDAMMRLVVCDTTVPRTLAGSEYNRRRRECDVAVTLLSSVLPGIRALRDVTPSNLSDHRALLPDIPLRRTMHVISENDRVHSAVDALWNREYSALGNLLNDSHASLRDNYNVSCTELDVITDICRTTEGVFGARMTGAGFGGCALAITRPDAVERLTTRIHAEYPARCGRQAVVTVCGVGDGAHALWLR